MMSSPFPTLFICLSYVYGVKVLGPKLMENRKPFQLKNVLIVYNLFQMVFSAWLFYEVRSLLRSFSLHPCFLFFPPLLHFSPQYLLYIEYLILTCRLTKNFFFDFKNVLHALKCHLYISTYK